MKVMLETKISDTEGCHGNATFASANTASPGEAVASARASPTEPANAQSGASVDALRDIRRVDESVASYAEEKKAMGLPRVRPHPWILPFCSLKNQNQNG